MPEPINGLYGKLYDENGQQVQLTQEFESTLEFEKESFTIPGKLQKSHKVLGAEGTLSFNRFKVDSRLNKKIAENPTAKYNYMGKLAEPTANGEEAILYIGVSFDSVTLMQYNVEEMTEDELEATFDDFRYVSTME